MRWQSWQLAHWGVACGILVWEKLVKKLLNAGSLDANEVRRGEEMFHKEAAVLDAHLAAREYLVNDALTIADFAVASFLEYAQPAAMPVAKYPNIGRWYQRVAALDAWRNTAPKM